MTNNKVEVLQRHLEEKTTVLVEKDKVIDECFPNDPLANLKRKSEEFLSSISTHAKKSKPDARKKVHLTVMMGGNINTVSRNQAAGTPKELFVKLDEEFHFTHDPCPNDPNYDGLKAPWGDVNFVNPPYKNCKKWVKKALEESSQGKLSVLLLPSRTGAKWFHKYILHKNLEIRFIQGYLVFEGYSKPAPFPSVIIVVRPQKQEKEFQILESQQCPDLIELTSMEDMPLIPKKI
jgi:site-specific DNA-methyltransferase (adenine-specific)